MAEAICAVYKITNIITNDFYIGSSKNVKQRWAVHKCQSTWNECPNNPMYQDMQKYGVDKFAFEILAEIEEGSLKEAEQEFIETLQPTYNNYNANGLNIEKHRKYQKKYFQSEKGKLRQKERYSKHREEILKQKKQYLNQLCYYNGETLTLNALSKRFKRMGIDHPTLEAKKYLVH